MRRPSRAVRRTPLRPVLAVILVVVALPLSAQEEGLYRSNDEFLPITEIAETDRTRYTYVLEVSAFPRRIERTLFRRGELFRRQVERVGVNGLPHERITYNDGGEVIETANYRYGPRGRLRSVEIRSEAETERLTAASGEESLTSEGEGESRRTIYRYDEAGRVVARLSYVGDELREEVRREYDNATLVLRVEEYPVARRRVVSRYNEAGVLVEEETFEAGRLEQRRILEYDESGQLVVERIRDRETREIRYTYRPDGELQEREEIVNGEIRRRVRYDEGERLELRFRRGEPFLRVFFRDDERVREEVLRGGEIIEVREFENG